jgi:hypothetical protein
MNESFLISSHNDFLSIKLTDIASKAIPCNLKTNSQGRDTKELRYSQRRKES